MTEDSLSFGREAESMLQTLAGFTSEPGRITRLYLTPSHRAASGRIAGWMAEAGLAVSEDAMGTVRGVLAAGDPASGNRRLLIGSHIDSVIDAGRYDGTLGVVVAILAVRELRRRGVRLPFGIEILAFGDEEGVRFPITLSSSSAVAGILERDALDVKDSDGMSVRDALKAFGCDPSRITEAAIDPDSVIGYLEVHIEQGPVLEQEGLALGVVTSIAGATRATFRVKGEAGHAGTVPMAGRKDALAAACELVVAIEAIARAQGGDLVATVGRMKVEPGAINVIPAAVEFSLDLRAGADDPREDAFAAITEAAEQIAARRGVAISWNRDHDRSTAPCAPRLQAALAAGIAGRGDGRVRSLMSGAGHDGHAMAALTDIGMMFVRCRGGVSHTPAEFCSVEDMNEAVEALVGTILALADETADQEVPAK